MYVRHTEDLSGPTGLACDVVVPNCLVVCMGVWQICVTAVEAALIPKRDGDVTFCSDMGISHPGKRSSSGPPSWHSFLVRPTLFQDIGGYSKSPPEMPGRFDTPLGKISLSDFMFHSPGCAGSRYKDMTLRIGEGPTQVHQKKEVSRHRAWKSGTSDLPMRSPRVLSPRLAEAKRDR